MALIFLLRWFFEDKFPMRPCSPILRRLLPKYLVSKVSPPLAHIQGIFEVELSFQIGEVWTGLVQKSDIIQPLLQMELLDLWMVLRIAFHEEFSNLEGGLGHFTDSNSIPKNQTTTSHPNLTVITHRTFLLFTLITAFSAMPFVSDRWGAEVRCFHDKSSQDLPNSTEFSLYMTFGFSDGLEKLS